MARIRTIKPEFFTSTDIVKLTPLARLFYVSIWCEADREGYLKWDVDALKRRYLACDEVDIATLAGELVGRGLVLLYVDREGVQYAEIPSFRVHQVINNREAASVLAARVKGACTRVQGEGKEGREGKGKEGKGTSPAQAPDAPPSGAVDGGDESTEKRRKRRGTEEDFKAARWMFGLVLGVNATARKPNFDVWADEVRLMREMDGHSHRQICDLFQWAKHDGFWCANIQSPGKLREKWNTLTEQRARGGQRGTPAEGKFSFAGADRSGDKLAQQRTMERHGITVPDGEVPF